MLKIDGVPLFNRETLKIGLVFATTMIIIGWALAKTVIGLLLYLNFLGYMTIKFFGIETKPRFLSIRSLSIGWSVFWRVGGVLFAFVIPYLPISNLITSRIILSPQSLYYANKLFAFTLNVLAFGWSVRRVGVLLTSNERKVDLAENAESCGVS